MEGVGCSCVRGVCLPDAAGVRVEPFFGVAAPEGRSTYSNFLESNVKVTGPYERVSCAVRTLRAIGQRTADKGQSDYTAGGAPTAATSQGRPQRERNDA